jgi:hypothetical protein
LALDPYGDYEYQELDVHTAHFIHAFRNSIGDLSTPSYDYWLERKKRGHANARLMIYMIWFFWIMNVITFTILLLNFLIAVIS